MMADAQFGTDCRTFLGGAPDLDPTFALWSGKDIVAEACARRLMTPRGTLVGDDAYGTDLRGYLSARITNVVRARIVSYVEAECRKDERVEAAKVVESVLPTPADPRMVLRIAVVAGGSGFDLVLSVSALTVEALVNG